MENNRSKAVALVAVLLLTACSDSPKPSTETKPEGEKKETPSEPVTAKTAFWEMYKLAHAWTADTLLLSLVSKTVPGFKNDAGKAAMWVGVFASPSRHEMRTFTYSIVDRLPEIRKGVDVARPVPWLGPAREGMPFQTSDFATDSDAAYQTALAMPLAGPWVKKHPDKEVSLTLGHASRFPAPVWYVLWGDNKSGFYALVNATTGKTISGK
jgi:hypothetical protein